MIAITVGCKLIFSKNISVYKFVLFLYYFILLHCQALLISNGIKRYTVYKYVLHYCYFKIITGRGE